MPVSDTKHCLITAGLRPIQNLDLYTYCMPLYSQKLWNFLYTQHVQGICDRWLSLNTSNITYIIHFSELNWLLCSNDYSHCRGPLTWIKTATKQVAIKRMNMSEFKGTYMGDMPWPGPKSGLATLWPFLMILPSPSWPNPGLLSQATWTWISCKIQWNTLV